MARAALALCDISLLTSCTVCMECFLVMHYVLIELVSDFTFAVRALKPFSFRKVLAAGSTTMSNQSKNACL